MAINSKLESPYIGVRGISTREQVVFMEELIPPVHKHLLMLGVLMDSNTLHEVTKNSGQLANLLSSHSRVLNIIHYKADSDKMLVHDLEQVAGMAGQNLHGFQINMAWPHPDILNDFRRSNPNLRLILQIGNKARELVFHQIDKLVEKVGEYNGIIDDVVIDTTGNPDLPFNPTYSLGYLKALASNFPNLGLGVAGGLNSETLPLMDILTSEFSTLSIDESDNLRNGNGQLDLNKCKSYLTAAYQLLEGNKVGLTI